MLNETEYEKLKEVHFFLIAGAQNREHHHYSQKSKAPIVKSGWCDIIKKHSLEYTLNEERKYFPLLVLLDQEKENEKKYVIDEKMNRKILEH